MLGIFYSEQLRLRLLGSRGVALSKSVVTERGAAGGLRRNGVRTNLFVRTTRDLPKVKTGSLAEYRC